jgi:L-seryl-tRNA(Ser) seleniumtransferase
VGHDDGVTSPTDNQPPVPQAAPRDLAPVDEVLHVPEVAALCERYPRPLVVDAARTVLERLRREILEGGRAVPAAEVTAEKVAPWVVALVEEAVRPSLRRVINALGVVGHTNLGRSLLPEEAVRAMVAAASTYTDVEIDLSSGERGSRQAHVHDILCALTGAEDALVVNNNAAAVLLALAATARGGEVLVSRGQLVEIGDGFRIPDILRESGADLVEVGTTNRTYLSDFEEAWSERTRAILRVHTSNYRIVGFTTEPGVVELSRLAAERGAVLIDDLGSGALGPLEVFAEEPGVSESVSAGADAVTFSGDKLLGGPQAGIVVGRAATIEAMRRHPLARAVRIDKIGIAALDVLLRLYLDPEAAVRCIPTLSMLAATEDEVAARAADLGQALSAAAQAAGEELGGLEVISSVARAGAGALPVTDVPSAALAVSPPDGDAHGLAERLRRGEPAVLARVQEGRVLLDLRAVRDEEVDELAGAVLRALR